MSTDSELVYIDDYGLRGTNFYWHKYEAKGLTKEDILNAGLTSDRVQVHASIINALQKVNELVGERGYEIFIKEGYRSKALYEIVYQRRVEKFGKEETDRLLNMDDMPHASGLSVDVALWDKAENKEVFMRNGDDGTDALFVDFYKLKIDENSVRYQALQEWFIGFMLENGFRLGTKREYFHFDYRPETQSNY
jgi:D-alanyl-D-alanine dipeptidase